MSSFAAPCLIDLQEKPLSAPLRGKEVVIALG